MSDVPPIPAGTAVGAVLVYGADRHDRLAAHRSLSAHGYSVLLASSQAEAAKCIASGRVRAIVLTDDGRAELPRGRTTPSAPSSGADYGNILQIRFHPLPGMTSESALVALIAAVKAAFAA